MARMHVLCEGGKGRTKAAQKALAASHYWLDMANRRRGYGDGSER